MTAAPTPLPTPAEACPFSLVGNGTWATTVSLESTWWTRASMAQWLTLRSHLQVMWHLDRSLMFTPETRLLNLSDGTTYLLPTGVGARVKALAYHSMTVAANLDLPFDLLLSDALLAWYFPAWALAIVLWPPLAAVVGILALFWLFQMCRGRRNHSDARRAQQLGFWVAVILVFLYTALRLLALVWRIVIDLPLVRVAILGLAVDAFLGALMLLMGETVSYETPFRVVVAPSLVLHAIALGYFVCVAPSASMLTTIAATVPVVVLAGAFVWAVAAAATEVYFAVHVTAVEDTGPDAWPPAPHMELPLLPARAAEEPPWFGSQRLPRVVL